MSLCVLAGGKVTTLAISAFTLAWTHSVQHTRWEEDWRVTEGGLQLVEARVKGSGAGMEPPPHAVLKGGWWSYVPEVPPLPELVLAASGRTDGGWQLCATGECTTLGAVAGEPVRLAPCEGATGPWSGVSAAPVRDDPRS